MQVIHCFFQCAFLKYQLKASRHHDEIVFSQGEEEQGLVCRHPWGCLITSWHWVALRKQSDLQYTTCYRFMLTKSFIIIRMSKTLDTHIIMGNTRLVCLLTAVMITACQGISGKFFLKSITRNWNFLWGKSSLYRHRSRPWWCECMDAIDNEFFVWAFNDIKKHPGEGLGQINFLRI